MKTIIRFTLLITFAIIFTHCSTSKPKKSIENLKTAFNSESTASSKYSKFAQVALTEGFDTIAKLFDAVSKSENIHAFNHGKALEKLGVNAGIAEIGSFEVKTTIENLQTAINGETYEMNTMYTGFIRTAEEEKAPVAGKSFTWAIEAEKKHLNYFRQAAAAVALGNESGLPVDWLVCPTCGNTIRFTDVKDLCDFCLTKKENFIGFTEEQQ
jgi:rubrerythrin